MHISSILHNSELEILIKILVKYFESIVVDQVDNLVCLKSWVQIHLIFVFSFSKCSLFIILLVTILYRISFYALNFASSL